MNIEREQRKRARVCTEDKKHTAASSDSEWRR